MHCVERPPGTNGRNTMFICFHGELHRRSTVNSAQSEYANKDKLERSFLFSALVNTLAALALIISWIVTAQDLCLDFVQIYQFFIHFISSFSHGTVCGFIHRERKRYLHNFWGISEISWICLHVYTLSSETSVQRYGYTCSSLRRGNVALWLSSGSHTLFFYHRRQRWKSTHFRVGLTWLRVEADWLTNREKIIILCCAWLQCCKPGAVGFSRGEKHLWYS